MAAVQRSRLKLLRPPGVVDEKKGSASAAKCKAQPKLTKEEKQAQAKARRVMMNDIFKEPAAAQQLGHRAAVDSNKVLRVCSDFGGMEGSILSLKRLQSKGQIKRIDHLTSSDTCPGCRKWIEKLSPKCKVSDNAITRPLKDVPEHDIYTACWPCQPYARGAKGEGANDSKQRGAIAIMSSLKLIKKHKPIVVMSEQSAGILQPKHIGLLLRIVRAFREVGYLVFACLVNLRYFVAQRRKRVYLACIKKGHYNHNTRKFAFPTRKTFVSAAKTWGRVMAKQAGRKPCLIPKHERNSNFVKQAFAKLWAKEKINPMQSLVCVDIECSARFATTGVDVHPCLTATRGSQGGCLVSTTSLKPGLPALSMMQGHSWEKEIKPLKDVTGLSESKVGHMLGNAVTGDFAEELWCALLTSAGLMEADPSMTQHVHNNDEKKKSSEHKLIARL